MSDEWTEIEEDWTVPPWERPGGFRRDGERHRGDLLLPLAILSMVVSAFSAIPCYVIGGFIAVPLSFTVWYLARRDLARMRKGLVDPRGEEETDRARDLSLAALVAAFFSPVYWGIVYLVLALR